MDQAASIADFKRTLLDRWVFVGSGIVWCASPTLCGCICWGRPSRGDAERVLDAFGAFEDLRLAPAWDAVLDVRSVESIDPLAFAVLVGWVAGRREKLARRIRIQAGVIPDTIVGITFAGILPALGESHAFAVFRDPRLAFEHVLPSAGKPLCDTLEGIVERMRDVPRWLVDLRAIVRGRLASASLELVARELGLSSRTLQRQLGQRGSSFQSEVALVRFTVAEEMLQSSDVKISEVAAVAGLSERGLEQLVQRRAGCSPAELRSRARA